ncbi:uncharacterized protein TM35_000341480 [Trypanosoma theileri]|uniref:Uncharacterized protein n=1 Tax=Trypanosoma theileri TaxID=67003 RepID=A0A1X0NLE8_9TRYP|nr:uncharacterized protein TM35_000341480 [Trypanosoma theileri]ORC85536.1 hypothetical protein TM35_000341480 [Trypanosoma theileri]
MFFFFLISPLQISYSIYIVLQSACVTHFTMGSSSKSSVDVDKVPYSNVMRDRRLAAQKNRWRMPRATTLMIPATLLFAIGGFCYTYWWNDKRSREGPCIDCKRQQEIMEEVYFKKPAVQKGYRL